MTPWLPLVLVSCGPTGLALDSGDPAADTDKVETQDTDSPDTDAGVPFDDDDPSDGMDELLGDDGDVATPSVECPERPWYADRDGDGYGDASSTIVARCPGAGWLADDSDCDDTKSWAHPGAIDHPLDGVDGDCDGTWSITAVGDLLTWRAEGAESVRALGSSISMAGDINGDGQADLLISASRFPASAGSGTGGAMVFLGPFGVDAAAHSSSDAQAILVGSDNDRAKAVCAPGDVDGDGYGEVVVSGPIADRYTGVLYLVRGPVSGTIDLATDAQTLRGEFEGAYFGNCAAPGDLDGDGLADLVVGSSENKRGGLDEPGSVYVFYGPMSESTPSDATTIFRGDVAREGIGSDVIELGDVDADGRPDFATSNDENRTADGVAAYVITDPATGIVHPRDAGITLHYDSSGRGAASQLTVNRVGDIDGDGADDIGIGSATSGTSLFVMSDLGSGASSADVLTGYAAVLSSATTWLDYTSTAVGLGDRDGDGFGDLAVSNAYYTPVEYRSECEFYSVCYQGAVFLVNGPIDGVYDLETVGDRIEGDAHLGNLGRSLAGGSDLDGDGVPDLAFGAPYATVLPYDDAGVAYILFGSGLP